MLTVVIVTITVASFGIVSNASSLFYFILKSNTGLGNRLLILLNTLDMILCATTFLLELLDNYESTSHTILAKVAAVLITATTEGTGFVTCLLSITRSICIHRPFYQIRHSFLLLAFVVFMSYITIRECIYRKGYMTTQQHALLVSSSILSMVLIVVVSAVFSLFKLLKSTGDEEAVPATNKRATVTIVIISLLFCFFNSLYCFTLFLVFGLPTDATYWANQGVLYDMYDYTYFIAIPLNSALNPLVYFYRKREMRLFLKNMFWCRCSLTNQANRQINIIPLEPRVSTHVSEYHTESPDS